MTIRKKDKQHRMVDKRTYRKQLKIEQQEACKTSG